MVLRLRKEDPENIFDESEKVRKQGKLLYNFICLMTKKKHTDIYPVSSIVLFYLMDPVMWDIKYRIPKCRYKSRRKDRLNIIYADVFYIIYYGSTNRNGISSDYIEINTRFGNIIDVMEHTFPCKLRKITDENFEEIAKEKEFDY